jgi:hypothetical protein
MKRNWDIIRKIMIKLEELPSEGSQLDSDAICGVDNEAAFYHMRLMIEAGMAVGSCPEMLGRCHGFLFRLTWEGHEMLDKIRQESIWNKIKEAARVKGLDLSVDVVKAIALNILGKMVQ